MITPLLSTPQWSVSQGPLAESNNATATPHAGSMRQQVGIAFASPQLQARPDLLLRAGLLPMVGSVDPRETMRRLEQIVAALAAGNAGVHIPPSEHYQGSQEEIRSIRSQLGMAPAASAAPVHTIPATARNSEGPPPEPETAPLECSPVHPSASGESPASHSA